MPLVSVIVPVFNGERFLADALDSALAQTLDDVEIIVVDDGSTDSSAAIARDYAARHAAKFVVIAQANGGVCVARNAGIAAARGTYLAMLDADDIWMPGHLADCVAILETRGSVGLVHANIERINADGSTRHVVTRFWDRSGEDAFATIYLRREHVSCSTVVVRRELVERVGGFDIAFNRLGSEDRDLWLRCAAVSDFVFIDAVHARYRMHDENASRQIERMHRARMLLIEKFSDTARGRPLRRRALAGAFSGLGDEWLDARKRGAAVHAYFDALLQTPGERRVWKGLLRSLLLPSKRRAV